MKLKVMYHSRSGNTKKLAEAVAGALGQTVEAIPPAYPLENVDLLFLGSGSYGNKCDKKMDEFIRTLNGSRVKNVALFGTSGGKDTHLNYMKTLLKEKGINVIDEVFNCKGRFFVFFSRKHPDSKDLDNVREFARRCVDKLAK